VLLRPGAVKDETESEEHATLLPRYDVPVRRTFIDFDWPAEEERGACALTPCVACRGRGGYGAVGGSHGPAVGIDGLGSSVAVAATCRRRRQSHHPSGARTAPAAIGFRSLHLSLETAATDAEGAAQVSSRSDAVAVPAVAAVSVTAGDATAASTARSAVGSGVLSSPTPPAGVSQECLEAGPPRAPAGAFATKPMPWWAGPAAAAVGGPRVTYKMSPRTARALVGFDGNRGGSDADSGAESGTCVLEEFDEEARSPSPMPLPRPWQVLHTGTAFASLYAKFPSAAQRVAQPLAAPAELEGSSSPPPPSAPSAAAGAGEAARKDAAGAARAGPERAVWSSWVDAASSGSACSEESSEDDEDLGLCPIYSATAALPSLGSAGHGEGTCRRCCFFPKGRCNNRYDCQFCHFAHEKRKPKSKKKKHKKRRGARKAQAALAAAAGLENAGGGAPGDNLCNAVSMGPPSVVAGSCNGVQSLFLAGHVPVPIAVMMQVPFAY
jgi:hypothetical protein